MGMMKYFVILFLMSSLLFSGIDQKARYNLKWNDNKLAGVFSDIGLYGSFILPYASTYGKWKQYGKIAIMQFSVMGFTDVVKRIARRKRPDGSDNRSFFSGHSSITFVNAGLTCSLGNIYMCLSSIAIASSVGYLRIAADKHWLSDVVVGASVGFVNGFFVPTLIMRF